MFKIGDKVTVKKYMSIGALMTLNQASIFENKIYKILKIELVYNSYYGGSNQLLKFNHFSIGLSAEYFEIVRASVGFVID
jgi:hypothetical protein